MLLLQKPVSLGKLDVHRDAIGQWDRWRLALFSALHVGNGALYAGKLHSVVQRLDTLWDFAICLQDFGIDKVIDGSIANLADNEHNQDTK